MSPAADSVSSGTWGEIPPQQGGVIIPYLVKVPLKAGTTNQPASQTSWSINTASFGYADCLKWGYNGTLDIAVVEVQKAATFLGLDIAQVVDCVEKCRGVPKRQGSFSVFLWKSRSAKRFC
jgi:hypothetical protein